MFICIGFMLFMPPRLPIPPIPIFIDMFMGVVEVGGILARISLLVFMPIPPLMFIPIPPPPIFIFIPS